MESSFFRLRDEIFCDVPITFTEDALEAVINSQLQNNGGGARRKRGRLRKKLNSPVSKSDFNCDLLHASSLVDLDVTTVVDEVWRIGKQLGVQGPHTDVDIVRNLEDLEARDRLAAGRGTG
ncbi:DUF4179 domain-containing protein [Sesbania bispinosa]|nr:DUF4179 domain-containing protein [Sesbania bispinosa]